MFDVMGMTVTTPRRSRSTDRTDRDHARFGRWVAGHHVETFSDTSGNPVVVRRHVIFTGTVSNTATGEAVPYVGDFTVTRDGMADTNAYAGLFRETVVPGQPPIIAAGHMVTTADFPPQLISESGRSIDAWLAAVCQLTGS